MFKNLNASALGLTGHQSEIIELALTYGFRGIDVKIEEFSHRAQKHGLPYARRLIDSAKIRLGAFQLPLEWDTDDELFKQKLAKLSEYAQLAAEIGCTRCLATVQPAGDKRPYHENFEFHRHRFSDICRALEPSGVRLGVGFRAADELRKGRAFQFIHELDALMLLTKMVDAANIGVLVDVWEVHVCGGSPESIRAIPADQIVAVRLGDLAEDVPAGDITEASRVFPQPTGRIDISAYLVALAELGYDGPVTPLAHRKAIRGIRRDLVVRRAGEALSTVWQAAGLTPAGKHTVAAER